MSLDLETTINVHGQEVDIIIYNCLDSECGYVDGEAGEWTTVKSVDCLGLEIEVINVDGRQLTDGDADDFYHDPKNIDVIYDAALSFLNDEPNGTTPSNLIQESRR